MKAKKILYAVCILAYSMLHITNSFSQTWLWAKSASGSGMGEGYSVSSDASGKVFITGFFKSPTITFGSTLLTNADVSGNTPDIFIAKYDAGGNVLWAKSAEGISWDEGLSASADIDGNVFVTGDFTSPTITFGTTTLTNAGNKYVFIAKYDAAGNVLWAKSSGGAGWLDEGLSVSADAGGNAYVSGYFFSPAIIFGTTTLTNAGSIDMFIAKYDAGGNVLWAQRAGGTSADEGYSVSAGVGGNVFVTGYFGSSNITFGTTTLSNAGGGKDVFIAEYDAAGNATWAKKAGGTNDDIGYSVSADAGGNVFLTGGFYSSAITFGTTILTNAGLSLTDDVFIAKYNGPTGNMLWAKSAGGTSQDIGYSVCADLNGNIYVTGGFNSTAIIFGSTTLLPPPGNCPGGMNGLCDPMFIVKYDANGNLLCASALACGGEDQNSVSTDSFGNAYIGADFEATPFFIGSGTFPLTGTEDVFVAKYTCCSNIAATITGANPICQGSSTTLNASGGIIYSWSSGGTDSTITLTPSTTTTYTVQVTDNNSCTGNATFTVTVLPAPFATAAYNVTIAQGQNATLTASGGGTYLWSNGSSDAIITVSPTVKTQYCVTVTGANSCTDTACVIATLEPIDCSEALYVPNAFSPNGDGENDVFKIYFGNINCIKTFELHIYNRWGEKVFETTEPNFLWDGTYKSTMENTAVFNYYMKAAWNSGKDINMTGNISLLR